MRSFALALPFVVAGAFSRPVEAQGFQYFAVTPCQAADARPGYGGIVQTSIARGFTIKGVCGVPATAKAVSLNLTIVGPTDGGFFSLWPYGGVFPNVSTINFNAGELAITNGAIVPLAAGTPDIYAAYGTATGGGWTNAILDVTGYFQ